MVYNSNIKAHLIIALFSLFVNWPIFFSDLLVNDDLSIITAQESGDFDGLKASFFDQAKPSAYYIHRILAFILPVGKTYYLAVNFFCITLTAMLFFAIARQAWHLSKSTALISALGVLCFPAYGIQPFAVAVLKFIASTMLFGGIFLAHRYWRGELKWPSLFVACFMVAESALHASSIPFLHAFLFSFFLVEIHKRVAGKNQPHYSLVKGFYICVLLSIAVTLTFLIETFLFKQHDYFRGSYNQIKLEPLFIINGLIAGIKATFGGQFVRLSEIHGARLLTIVLFNAIGTMILIYFPRNSTSDEQDKRTTGSLFLLFMVVFLLIMAVFPYAAVGKIPVAEGYQSRWASYVGVGGGLFLGLLYEVGRSTKHRVFKYSMLSITVYLMLAFTSVIWDNYGKWQRVAIENNAMVAKLKTLPQHRDIDFFCVDTDILSEQFYFRRWYDWAYIYSKSWPTNRETMGFNSSYCRDRAMYKDGKLPTELPLVSIIPASPEDMGNFAKWMYYGKSKTSYRLATVNIHVGDKSLDQLQGTDVIIESLKDKWIGSDIIESYRRQLSAQYF